MVHAEFASAMLDAPVLELLMRERGMALSKREWQFRLAGYGYAIREDGGAQVVTSLAHGTDLGVLPVGMI